MLSVNQKNLFSDKTAVVTGGSRGIGFATAQAFINAGAHVAVCARNPKRLREAAAQLSTMGRVLTEVADVREPSQVMRFVDHVQETFGLQVEASVTRRSPYRPVREDFPHTVPRLGFFYRIVDQTGDTPSGA